MEIHIALVQKRNAFKSEHNCLRTHIVKNDIIINSTLHDLL